MMYIKPGEYEAITTDQLLDQYYSHQIAEEVFGLMPITEEDFEALKKGKKCWVDCELQDAPKPKKESKPKKDPAKEKRKKEIEAEIKVISSKLQELYSIKDEAVRSRLWDHYKEDWDRLQAELKTLE